MSENILKNPKIKNLINKGISKGFLTYKELLAAVPDAESNLELLDAVYAELMEEKVDIVDEISRIAPKTEAKTESIEETLDRLTPEAIKCMQIGVAYSFA